MLSKSPASTAYTLEIRQELLTFSFSGERRGRNVGAAAGFLLNKDMWKEKIIYPGWTFLKERWGLWAKFSHHNNPKLPLSVNDLTKGILTECRIRPKMTWEFFWHILHPAMNWCDHIQLPGAAFCLPNLGAGAAQASGRTSTGGQAASPASGHKMQARVSLLLSEGTLTSLASHLTAAGAGALLSRHAKAHHVRGVWFYIGNTVGEPLSWCKSAVLWRQPSYSDCPQQVDPISIFTWDTFLLPCCLF